MHLKRNTKEKSVNGGFKHHIKITSDKISRTEGRRQANEPVFLMRGSSVE